MKKTAYLLILTFVSTICFANTLPFNKRKDVQAFIKQMHLKYHFDTKKLNQLMSKVEVQHNIIESMNKPYEKKPWRDYRKLFLTDKRIQEGIAFWQKHKTILTKAEKKYGVSTYIITAILGVETYYGRIQGRHRVIDALSTLAFEYPKRARFFKKELAQFLLLCKELSIKPLSVLGSYAGAIGQPQFMPSSYRYYAVDFTGNGNKDLRNNTDDVIGSVANYFYKHGWKTNQLVAVPAKIKGPHYKKLNIRNKKAKYSLKKLAHLGVKPQTLTTHMPKKAGLIQLNNPNKKEYWLAYNNFYVITRYNTSKQYALVVHLLAQEIQKGVDAKTKLAVIKP